MNDSLDDLNQSAKSPKRKVQHHVGVPNAVKLDIQGGHVIILVLISIQIMKAMSWQLRIRWMVHGCPVVRPPNIKGNFPLLLLH